MVSSLSCKALRSTRLAQFFVVCCVLLMLAWVLMMTSNVDNQITPHLTIDVIHSDIDQTFDNTNDNSMKESKNRPSVVADYLQNGVKPPPINYTVLQMTSEWYLRNYFLFCNGCDFNVNRRTIADLCRQMSPSVISNHTPTDTDTTSPIVPMTVFIVGANRGQSTSNIIDSDGCHSLSSNELQMHIFEAVPELYTFLKKAYARNDRARDIVHINNNAVSDSINKSLLVHSDLSGRGGVHTDKFSSAEMPSRGLVDCTTFAHYAESHDISRVDYAIIDVEGHEVEVVLGMHLESQSHRFPMFQVELGGTWVDPRHTAKEWRQSDLVRYLMSFSYECYLMGAHQTDTAKNGFRRANPLLMRIHPYLFDDPWHLRGDGRGHNNWYAQGNLLAIRWEFIRPAFVDIVRNLVEELTVDPVTVDPNKFIST